MRSLIDIDDLSVDEIDELIQTAIDIMNNPTKYENCCKGKKLATLFYEPSTRTRLSFTAAMMELGGNVLGFSGAANSSVSKGESVHDTARVVSCYADIIAMRTTLEGAALVASRSGSVPVINAGDGRHSHPTQTLADLLTIYRMFKTFDNLTIGFCGDLKYGRTVHSLLSAISRYKNIKVVLISPKELQLPNYIKEEILDKNRIPYIEVESLEDNISSLDCLYMTRIQRERFDSVEEYEKLKDSYILTVDKMKFAKEKMCVLHPLPRVNEISVKVDDDSRARYFEQALNGKYMRMALIIKLLKIKEEKPELEDTFKNKGYIFNKYVCSNPKCISSNEQELEQVFKKINDKTYRCVYCEIGEIKTN